MLMRSDELALLSTEIKRRLRSWRFVFVLAAMTFFVWGITNQMLAFGAGSHVDYNVWDVFLGVFGGTANSLTPPVIFPVLIIFMLSSTIQEDILSGYSLIVQARLERKNSYWWIKVLAILVVVAVTIAALYLISLLLGAARGFAVFPAVLSGAGGHPNAWTIAKEAPPIYYSLPKGANVVVHGLLVATYFIFAYFAVVIFVAGLTVRVKNLYTPLAFGALVTASQLAVVSLASGFFYNFNLVTALTESQHRVIPTLSPPQTTYVPWLYSIILLSGFLVAGLTAGTFLTPTRISKAWKARRRAHIPAAVVISIFLLLLGTSLTGCTSLRSSEVDYEQFVGGAMPGPPQPIKLGELSGSDMRYLRAIAQKTIGLSNAWADLANIFGPKYLHAGDKEISRLLKDRLASIDREVNNIRALKPTPALAKWYRAQYAPGLEELEYIVDNLGPLYAKRDHLGVRMCLKHKTYADVYFSAAGQTIAPFAPQAVKGGIGNN